MIINAMLIQDASAHFGSQSTLTVNHNGLVFRNLVDLNKNIYTLASNLG